MIKNAFGFAKRGVKCQVCGELINPSYVQRHKAECKPKPTVVSVDNELSGDSDIEVVDVQVNTPVSKKAVEILISDDDEACTTSESRNAATTPKSAMDTTAASVEDASEKPKCCDPTAGLTLSEVYEKLMDRLKELRFTIKTGKGSASSQSNGNASQSLRKSKPEVTDDKPSLDKNNTTDAKSAKMSDPNNFKPELLEDQAEKEILQSKPKYGPSYVVRFFWKMLERVLSRQAGIQGELAEDFWGDDLRIIYWLITLNDAEQHMFIRLCLRHRRWLTTDQVKKFESEDTDINCIVANLVAAGLIEESNPKGSSLSLDEALLKLSKNELIRLARTYRVEYRLKVRDIIENILAVANGKCVFGKPMYPSVLENAKKHLGSCYRVQQRPLDLFNAILTLYCPLTMNSSNVFDPKVGFHGLASNLMFQLLQIEKGEIEFCGPKDLVKCISIFSTQQELMDYVAAKRCEVEMAHEKQCGRYQSMFDIGAAAIDKLKRIVNLNPSLLVNYASMPHHLRRFTEIWVLVRCAVHTVETLERLRRYDDAVELINYLMHNESLFPFFPDQRGHLYDRLALDLHSHLKQKEDAYDACLRGISDPIVRDRDRLLLQDRAMRLSKDFEPTLKIKDPKWVHITGRIVDKGLGDARLNHFYVDEGNGIEIVNVEELAVRYFRKEYNFYGGLHSEGGIWHTVFGILCYDIIFDHSIDGVWLSPVQSAPSDMNTMDFYKLRQEKFEERFSLMLEEGESAKAALHSIMTNNYTQNYGRTNAQVDWSCFAKLEDFLDFLSCVSMEQLTMILRRIALDHRHCRSGFPDLTLWDPETKRLAVIEVKGPGDKLSTKQRLWLDFFATHGVEAAVCQVFAEKRRKLATTTKKSETADVQEPEEDCSSTPKQRRVECEDEDDFY